MNLKQGDTMPTIYYWPQKSQPQKLSYLHKLSLDGVTLQQGPNEVGDQELDRVSSHPDLPWLVACGIIELSDQPQAVSPAPVPSLTVPPALALINGNDVARDVAIIPTIGNAAARRIIENRPPGGYTSLEQVWEINPYVLGGRMLVDPEVVAAWGGDGH